MKNIGQHLLKLTLGLSLNLFNLGCERNVIGPDYDPPAAPRGVYSVTGDGQVTLYWYPNAEKDLDGYDVYRGDSCAGFYYLIGTTTSSSFVDLDVINGETYYYAVLAFDVHGNESDLSYDCIFDTPRPEGTVTLYDFNQYPNDAGFDFSQEARVAWNSVNADIYLEYFVPDGIFYINTAVGVDIQDFGYVDNFDNVDFAPNQGWSVLGYVEVILGHAYIIWTADNHYAKIRVENIGASSVGLAWAYQTDPGNGELKPLPPSVTNKEEDKSISTSKSTDNLIKRGEIK
ncbi:MAG: hypothetical protein RBG1_1C00001G1236 [candidate division Zixibacteria bacterium RBG-1]|nr:MAG: hypothetical protein RBG1_1C00001G1236 [candidate division Zixibacteria bacterium RBG-1]